MKLVTRGLTGSARLLQIGCNSVSWGPAVHPGSLMDSTTADKKLVKKFVSGGCDNLIKIWR